MAIGELFVILTGGIDLSVGSVMGLAGVAAAGAMKFGFDPLLAILFGLLVGLAVGAINGALIAYVRIAPFIVTLAMLSFARGLILILTEGWPITQIPKSFLPIGQSDFLALPIPLWIMLVAAVIAWFVLTKTAFGRRTYAIGGNEQATFLSGINVKAIKFRLYMISSLCAALVGVILVARFNSAQADTGTGWELDAIAAAVIGGTSLMGGVGSVLRRPHRRVDHGSHPQRPRPHDGVSLLPDSHHRRHHRPRRGPGQGQVLRGRCSEMAEPRSPYCCEMRGISKTFPGVHALRGVDFMATPGRGSRLSWARTARASPRS